MVAIPPKELLFLLMDPQLFLVTNFHASYFLHLPQQVSPHPLLLDLVLAELILVTTVAGLIAFFSLPLPSSV